MHEGPNGAREGFCRSFRRGVPKSLVISIQSPFYPDIERRTDCNLKFSTFQKLKNALNSMPDSRFRYCRRCWIGR